MHEAKKGFEKDKEKSKTWFKSMFDKNKHVSNTGDEEG